MKKSARLLISGLFVTLCLPAFSYAADVTPPGCYAEAKNANELQTDFRSGDPDAQLTVARQAADYISRFVDPATGRIKTGIPADVTAALRQLGYGPGDLIAGATPLARMQTIAGKISTLGSRLSPEAMSALREQVSSALFGRDVTQILDIPHLGTDAFQDILQLANLDALSLSQLQTFVDVPLAQVNAIVSSIQGIPNQLEAFISGTATQQVNNAMAALGIDLDTARSLYALRDTNPKEMLSQIATRLRAQMTAVGEAGLNRLQEMIAPLVGGQAIASALTDLVGRGTAFMNSLLANLPISADALIGALTNLLGNMFNLNWLFGGDALSEDYGYRNEDLMGLEKVWGPQPSEPMPHKRTLRFSAQTDLSKWYLTNIQMPKTDSEEYNISPDLKDMIGQYAPYVGAAYRGTNDLELFRTRINQAGEGTSPVTCHMNIEPAGGKPDPTDPAWARIEVDNCINQWIMNHARFPRIVHEEAGSYRYINETMCQAMRIIPLSADEKADYDPSRYLGEAWKRLLIDAEHVMPDRPGPMPTEPHYASVGTVGKHGKFNLKVSKPEPIPECTETDPEKQVENCFGKVKINELIEKVPERIYDPSHPFSPRWDFNDNERKKYSKLTAAYDPLGAGGMFSVRCAGRAVPYGAPGSIPVDLLNFRLDHKWENGNFHWWIMRRIAANTLLFLDRDPYVGLYYRVWQPNNCSAREPCCSTAWDVDDKLSGALKYIFCGSPDIDEMCEYMAKPVAPINVLKMRDSTDTTIYPNKVPDGYKFSTYFGINRPYMRCWDTGSECGSTTIDPDYTKSDGANYALMGAGREEQSCTIGGDGDIDNRLGFAAIFPSDSANPIADWMELKLYQVNAQRVYGLKCLPRHEETFKIGQGEHFALYKAGVEVQQDVEIPDPKTPGGKMIRQETFVWPWGWRGYVSEPDPKWRFPNFGIAAPVTLKTGLDEAKSGDILVFDKDVVQSGAAGSWRNPYLAIVSGANTPFTNPDVKPEKTYITAYAINHGKFPDACGNTDRLFTGATYEMYKSAVPEDFGNMLKKLGAPDGTCDDPALAKCKETKWDTVKRYRFDEDVRN
ncbi:MAG: hypothetical protein U1E36_08945 [Rickettsiales bacterium]